jgi:maltose alpha-D-glucosyltransferase/alpha-amylase
VAGHLAAPVAETADWYRDAVIYEVHVRTFFDANGDGVGDFRGLTDKLWYLKDLGVTAIWLLPFYPSPLRDDGYDIADYVSVHPQYGTLRDFRRFLRRAHALGLKVITELVLNHTSDQHPWFDRARQSQPGSMARNFYVWSDTPERYRDARIIFKDFERSNWTWDPVAEQYYWHRFYSHQPDLNFDSPHVRRAMLKVVDFWLSMGVDGLRLDAVPYLYEREGTTCENLPETHAFLKDLRRHIDQRYPNRMLLAEANQWPEEAVEYFGDGDECHMAYHFPLMPRLFMALYMEDRYPVVDILNQTPPVPDAGQWAIFLRNHDELTLEMVTDEERDYMYQVYATDPQARLNLGIRRRLAPLLGNNRRRIELMHALLFALPGTPVLYYGNEIGMGDNIYLGDRDGVRTPFQWSGDRNAGFSTANPQRLCLPVVVDPEYHYEAVNVDAQRANPHSLLWWTKRLIALRKRHPAFGRGSMTLLSPENAKVLAFIRRLDDAAVLVVANLSRFVQAASLDLHEYQGSIPVELFGQTSFPPVTAERYFLTLGPHGFYYFQLTESREPASLPPNELPAVRGRWPAILTGARREELSRVLFPYVRTRRWFSARSRDPRGADVRAAVPWGDLSDTSGVYATQVEVACAQGGPATFWMALGVTGEPAPQTVEDLVLARLEDPGALPSLLLDATPSASFMESVMAVMARPRALQHDGITIRPVPLPLLKTGYDRDLRAQIFRGEQSNTSATFGDRFILKLYRQVHFGAQPDWEMGLHLDKLGFPYIPKLAGALDWEEGERRATLAVAFQYVPNQGDAWTYARDAVDRFFELVEATGPGADGFEAEGGEAGLTARLLSPFLPWVSLLAERTAALHRALASPTTDSAFQPEPFTPFYQRGLYQGIRTALGHTMRTLQRRQQMLDPLGAAYAARLLQHPDVVLDRANALLKARIDGLRIRLHGDLHLGQVLCTGGDFVFVDFEGEPARPLSERRIKRSPLLDVAGMLRSFHYAVWARAIELIRDNADAEPERVHRYANLWYQGVADAFLSRYREELRPLGLFPEGPAFSDLLAVYLLEKALYELRYELDHRPDWAGIPLVGLIAILEEEPNATTTS